MMAAFKPTFQTLIKETKGMTSVALQTVAPVCCRFFAQLLQGRLASVSSWLHTLPLALFISKNLRPQSSRYGHPVVCQPGGALGEQRDSNPQPQEPQSCALPIELYPPSNLPNRYVARLCYLDVELISEQSINDAGVLFMGFYESFNVE